MRSPRWTSRKRCGGARAPWRRGPLRAALRKALPHLEALVVQLQDDGLSDHDLDVRLIGLKQIVASDTPHAARGDTLHAPVRGLRPARQSEPRDTAAQAPRPPPPVP